VYKRQTDTNESLFQNLPSEFEVGHYHSWVIDPECLSDVLSITSLSEDGHITSISHLLHDVKGIQFHPESILTPHGKAILKNWLEM
jgi:anthranilate synthase component 2